jgi:ABC-type multidrug transport system ATPase subunit
MPSSTTTAPAAVLRGITVDLGGNRALDGVDLDIMSGALTVIAGPNGAGKSTLRPRLALALLPMQPSFPSGRPSPIGFPLLSATS